MKPTKEQMKELLTPKEGAFMKAMIENGTCHLEINARGIDEIALLMALTDHFIERAPLTIDEYCEMLKHTLRADKSLETFNQLFKDVVEDRE